MMDELPTLGEIADLFKVLCTVELDEQSQDAPTVLARQVRAEGLGAVSEYLRTLSTACRAARIPKT